MLSKFSFNKETIQVIFGGGIGGETGILSKTRGIPYIFVLRFLLNVIIVI